MGDSEAIGEEPLDVVVEDDWPLLGWWWWWGVRADTGTEAKCSRGILILLTHLWHTCSRDTSFR